MCIMCEGASRADVLSDIHRRVLDHGWALQAVRGDPSEPDWVYSIGLAELGHPELIGAGIGAAQNYPSLMSELGQRIRHGARFRVGDEVSLFGQTFGFGDVHVRHLDDGLVTLWSEYYAWQPIRPRFAVLQVIGPAVGCSCGKDHPPCDLSDPNAAINGRPNRAARQAQRRYRPRR